MSETGPKPDYSLGNFKGTPLEFIDNHEFEPKAGLFVQLRVAKELVSLMDPSKVTPDAFKRVTRAFDRPLLEGEPLLQEILIRDATRRIIGMIALMASDGDPDKAQALVGYHQDFDTLSSCFLEPEFDFVEIVQNYMKDQR